MKRIPQSFFLALFVFADLGFAQTQSQQTVPEEFWKEFSSYCWPLQGCAI